MNIRDVVKEQKAIGEKYGSGGSGRIEHCEMKIEFGFYMYPGQGRDRNLYWKPVPMGSGDNLLNSTRQEMLGRIKQVEQPEDAGKLEYGMRVWASGDILERDAPLGFDRSEFYPNWTWENSDGSQTDFQVIVDSVAENDIPLEKTFWAAYTQKAKLWALAKGEAGKTKVGQDGTKYYPTFMLPIKAFPSREAAQADTTGNSGATNNPNAKFSEKARELYGGDPFSLSEEVSKWFKTILAGTPFSNDPELYPLPSPLTPPAVKKQLADAYGIELGDIELLLLEEAF